MKIHTYGDKQAPVVIMLPGSFCNADTMANVISVWKNTVAGFPRWSGAINRLQDKKGIGP